MDISREVAFFDSFELRHGDYDVLGECAYRRLLGLFAELVLPQPGERCIDLGCGSGAFTRRLAEFQLDLTGLDISPRCIEAVRRASPHERYLVGDIRTTSFEAGAADIIVYSGVLHHCDQEAAHVEILKEGYRILRPGGRLFAFDPSAHSPSMWLYRDPRSPLYSSKGKTANEVLLTHRIYETSSVRRASASFRSAAPAVFLFGTSKTDSRGCSCRSITFTKRSSGFHHLRTASARSW